MPSPITAVTTGKNCRVTVNGSVIWGVQGHSENARADKLDATDAESQGFEQPDGGVKAVALTIRGVHKLALGPWPSVVEGNFISNVNAFLNYADPLAVWVFPVAFVESVQTDTRVRGQVEYTLTLHSWGTYTRPGE